MAELAVPATPTNFAVWYDHHAGCNPELSKGLNALMESGVAFTAALNREIYAKYFRNDRACEEISTAGSRIETLVGGMLQQLGEAGKTTADYGDTLAGLSGELSGQPKPEVMRAKVADLLKETQKVVEKNRTLQEQIGKSSEEISELRENLERVRQEAMTDELTGIANRHFFEARLREAAQEHGESGTALSLLMIDIDHFKKFNDTYGHRVGDEVLKVVGRVLRDGVKGRDAPARYGGEEFAVVLPQTCLRDAVTVAEQLRVTLTSRQLKNRKTGASYGTITISVGAAQYRTDEPLEEFVQRADEALYRAKRDGRNRVVGEVEPDATLGLVG